MADPAPDLSPVYDALRQAAAAGDTAGAQKLAAYIQSQGQPKFGTGKSLQSDGSGGLVPTGSAAAQAANSPTAGMSTLDKLRAGYGKGTMDLLRGAGQMIPWYRPQTMTGLITGDDNHGLGTLVSRKDVQDSRALDAPLMATGAGKVGDVAGSAVNMLPAAFIPGANTLAGAAAIGAGSGLMQPSTSTGQTLINTAAGGLLGPAGILAGRAGGALYQGGKAALEPLFQGGQQRVAARALQSFAGGPTEAALAAQRLANPPSVLPGVQPTTAELANNAGIAQMERSLRNNPEYVTALTNRNQANRGAMTSALGDIAGTDAQRQAAVDARSAAAKPLYDAAKGATVQADDTLRDLLQRPSMQTAWGRAQQLAQENGDQLRAGFDMPEHVVQSPVLSESGTPFTTTVPAQSSRYSGKAIQYLKMALNDTANTGPQNGMGAHEVNAVKSTLSSLNDWTSANLPALRNADAAYAKMSGPINQMDVGQALSNKLVPALGDFGNNTRLSAATYANAVRNGDSLAAGVTGNKSSTLGSVLSPQQNQTVRQVGEQLARRSNADELGRAVGSNTGQNVIAQNTLGQFLGPLGLPQSMGSRIAQNSFAQSLTRPLNFLTQMGTPKVMDQLAGAALHPADAANLLKLVQQNPKIAQMLWARQGLLGPIANTVGQGLLGNASQK